MWEIKTATEDDIASVIMQLGTHMNAAGRAAFLDKVERYVRKPDRTLFIALNGYHITGFSCIIEKGEFPGILPPRVTELVGMFAMTTGLLVHPDHREKGIGAALFRNLEQWAMKRRREGNWLFTHRKSHWYQRHFNYETIGRVLSKGVEKTIMAKKFE